MVAVTAQRDLVTLALAPSPTELERAARTHRAIREYLESDPALKKYRIDTYLQGSYKNSTNVRGDSDVDTGSLTEEVFMYDTNSLPSQPRFQFGQQIASLKESTEQTLNSYGPGGFTFWEYRADILASLQRQYGTSVEDGNKAIKVRGNTYRLDCDVLPCVSFRDYFEDWEGKASYHTGITFYSKDYKRVVNFPHQHFTNLADKDQQNDGKVKGCVRIFKRLRNELEERGEWDRKRSPSFYLESLVWNVPDDNFIGGYETVFQNVVAHLYNDLREKRDRGDLKSYIQANKVFVLFHESFWNVDDAVAFLEKLWQTVFK